MVRTRNPRVESLEARALLSTLMVESEPNNRPRMADLVGLENGSTSIHGTTRAGDRDLFAVPISTTGSMTLAFQSSGQGKLLLKANDAATGQSLFDAAGARSGSRTATFDVSAGQTLNVRVMGTGARAAAYSLTLTQLQGTGDPSSVPIAPEDTSGTSVTPATTLPNQDPAVPLTFDANGKATATGTLASQSDVDVYSFTAPKSGRLTLNARRSQVPTTVRVQDSSGRTLLIIHSDIPSITSSMGVVAGTTYYLRISPRTANAGSYEVSLSLV